MTPNGSSPQPTTPPSKRRAPWPLILLATLFIIVPFLTWYGTWFGRGLSDEEVATYLADEKNPRHIQHALSQVAERIERRDANVKKFYPQVILLSKHPVGEIRKTAAWVMGQDNTAGEFHEALVALLTDSEPLVRRNAALQLVRFGDASGRPELRAMLQSFEAKSPIAGNLVSVLGKGSKLKAGSLLARIKDGSNTVQEFRAPVDGAIMKVVVKEGDTVTAGQSLMWLAPDRAAVNDALRALAYVGVVDDLLLIDTYARESAIGDAEVKQQVATTVMAIQGRAEKK
jgi:acetyl/propionyl-CoA carboxylase alpha subunit